MYFKELVESLFSIRVEVKQRKDGKFRARIRSHKKIFTYLQNLLKGIKKEERMIPDFIVEDKYLGKEFLKVLFGCEGSACYDRKRNCVKIEIACRPNFFKKQIKKLLEKQSIDSKIYKNSIQIRRKESVIKFVREIGTLECFRVGRGKFNGLSKISLLSSVILEYKKTFTPVERPSSQSSESSSRLAMSKSS
jgi:hypothetical protein